MTADEGARLRRRRFDLTLPEIRGLQIRRIRFVPPELRNFRSRREPDRDAIEFIVELDGPVPARAYGPALYVGDVEVRDSERIDETTYRLVSLEPESLELDAPISWGWMKDPPPRRHQTTFRFALDEEMSTS